MNDNSQIPVKNWFDQTLKDGGPLYSETNADHFIVEPWNAVSSLFIIIPAIIWLVRIRKDYKNYSFMIYCIPLMILGGTGSTIFHAFRASKFFLLMDVLPTAVLSLSIGIYFWLKLVKNWGYVLLLLLLFIVPRFLLFRNLPMHSAINISYAFSGIFIGLPLVIILFKTSGYKIGLVITAIALFTLALIFRETDTYSLLFFPMGTHFLWHVFSGLGAYLILAYLYWFRKRELSIAVKNAQNNKHTILRRAE
jgi:hemolysin III